jgi:hypothetical protein
VKRGDVVILSRDGREVYGIVQGPPNGRDTAYVTLENGSSANFPLADLRPAENKDMPTEGLETK